MERVGVDCNTRRFTPYPTNTERAESVATRTSQLKRKRLKWETAHFVVDTEDGDDGWEGWVVFEEIEDMYLGVLAFELDDKVSAEALAAEMNAKGFPRSEEFGTWTWQDWFGLVRSVGAWDRMTDDYTPGVNKSFEMQAMISAGLLPSRTRTRFAVSVGGKCEWGVCKRQRPIQKREHIMQAKLMINGVEHLGNVELVTVSVPGLDDRPQRLRNLEDQYPPDGNHHKVTVTVYPYVLDNAVKWRAFIRKQIEESTREFDDRRAIEDQDYESDWINWINQELGVHHRRYRGRGTGTA